MQNTPFLILGGGAAAFAAATRANDLGIDTIMINAGLPLGGTCVNVGCVPSKNLLTHAAAIQASRSPAYPGAHPAEINVDYSILKRAREEVVAGLRQKNYRDVLASLGKVRVVEGKGKFLDPHTVEVDGTKWKAEKILIAVGSRPGRLEIPGLDLEGVVDSRGIWDLDSIPKRFVIVGGGPLGLEFAQAFSRLGAKVTVLEFLPQILGPLDNDVAQVAQEALEAEGITFETSARVLGIEDTGHGLAVRWQRDGNANSVDADLVLVASGVHGNADRIGAENAGLRLDAKGFLSVDDRYATNVSHIYAAGDVIGKFMLEHAAGKEGKLAADNLLTGSVRMLDYGAMPAAVFTSPEVAWVGWTERDYMEAHGVCKCRAVHFDRLPRGVASENTRGIARIAVDPASDRIVGAQMVGPHAADAIHEMVLAIRHGLTVDDIIDTVHIFPTWSEAFKLAALAFRRDISVMSCCID